MVGDQRDDTFGGVAIAVIGDLASGPVIGAAPQPVPAGLDRFNPLGFVAQGDTGHPVEIRFLLEPARVRIDDSRTLEQSVHVISLDDFFAHTHIKKIPRIVKIDVEGAELGVLRGMKRILKEKDAPDIIGEISRNGDEILNLMEHFGYRFYTLDIQGVPISYERQSNIKVKALLFSKQLGASSSNGSPKKTR